MSYPNPSTALAHVAVDELVRHGVRLFVVSPGSRSTALVIALADRADVEMVVAIDERSAGFHALGRAKAAGTPAAVVTTSGTAVANLMPAVVEADASGAPLLVLSADRPPEMRGVGTNQTINQVGLFGGFVRDCVELGPAEAQDAAPRWWRSAISSAVGSASGWDTAPGPVQINLAFREPTVPVSDDGRTRGEPYPHEHHGRTDGQPFTTYHGSRDPHPGSVDLVAERIESASQGLILIGSGEDGAEAWLEVGRTLGWPVLATASSGLRRHAGVVATGHHLLASEAATPDLVVRVGQPGPSRRVLDLLAGDVAQVYVGWPRSDPARTTGLMVRTSAGALGEALVARLDTREPTEWGEWWRKSDSSVRSALEAELTGVATEPSVAAAVGRLGADVTTVASSMPIRDVEMFAFDLGRSVSNRGASGIDGFVSTAFGVAPTVDRHVALAGDLSMLHDSNGFLCQPRPDCVFVVVDNGGGGIFSFLPQANHAGDHFERLFGTPHGRDLSTLAALHHVDYLEAGTTEQLETAVREGWAVGGCRIVVVKTDRSDNFYEHRRLDALVREVLNP